MEKTSLKQLKINDNRIHILNTMNIFTIEDLLFYYPYRYDVIEKTPLIHQEKVIIEGTVIDQPKIFFKGKMSIMSFSLISEDKNLHIRIYNRHFLRQHLSIGTIITVIGKYDQNKETIVANDIKIKPLKEVQGIHAIYSLKEGITQNAFSKYIQKAFHYYQGKIKDDVPDYLIEKHHLINREHALHLIHCPTQKNDVIEALKYLKYEEFLKFQITMQYIKKYRSDEIGLKKDINLDKIQSFINDLPFCLTDDQQIVVEEIIDDLKQAKAMYRFVQGDVGSGKTIVGLIGLYANYLAGYQGAMMAPTEILARQHYKNVQSLLKDSSIHIELLTGSLSPKEKEEIYKRLNNGDIDIIIGTHALFQEKVVFKNLGFIITDEQHRFGVKQRKQLKDKGTKVDFLVMSATPIPRTLAISLFGDMDVSTIKTMPSGRKEIKSEVYYAMSMKPVLKQLEDYLASGGQCYVICPLVNNSDAIEGRDAVQIHNAMSRYFKERYHVGLLHGQMNDEDKEKVMNDFKDNHYQILVSTTVVEVGVDVSNANMMVIYNSERFGLSQLHQLRGRIGRSNKQGYCFFLSGSKDPDVKERLEFLKNTNDGFEISMFDLKRRGPGEMLGSKQSGLPTFHIGDVFKDFHILEVAREDAKELLQEDIYDQAYLYLMEEVKEQLKKNNVYID